MNNYQAIMKRRNKQSSSIQGIEERIERRATAVRKSCDKVLCTHLLKTLVIRSHIIFKYSKTCTRGQLANYKQVQLSQRVYKSAEQYSELYLKPDLANMKSVEVGTRKDKHYQDVNQ